MNKLALVSFALVLSTISAMSIFDDTVSDKWDNLEEIESEIYEPAIAIVPSQGERSDRHRRVTCDILSVSTPWGSVNHAACAAHCLAMFKGYRGGRCINGVCNCRR